MVYPYSLLFQECGNALHAEQWDESDKRKKTSVWYEEWNGHKDCKQPYQSPYQYIFFFHLLFYVVILQRYEEIYLSLSVYIIFET